LEITKLEEEEKKGLESPLEFSSQLKKSWGRGVTSIVLGELRKAVVTGGRCQRGFR